MHPVSVSLAPSCSENAIHPLFACIGTPSHGRARTRRDCGIGWPRSRCGGLETHAASWIGAEGCASRSARGRKALTSMAGEPQPYLLRISLVSRAPLLRSADRLSASRPLSGLQASNLAPAFTPYNGLALKGIVACYRGATVPESHGIPCAATTLLKNVLSPQPTSPRQPCQSSEEAQAGARFGSGEPWGEKWLPGMDSNPLSSPQKFVTVHNPLNRAFV